MSWLTIEYKVFKRGVEYSKLFSQSHSLWCGNILFIKDACLDIHRKKHVSCSQRHLSPEGGVPISGALCILKPLWWHLVNYLNMHGRFLLKVSNAISARFILPSYFLANSSLPPLSIFYCCFFYFSSLSNTSFSPLYDFYTLKLYWRCFKRNSEHQAHYFHVRTDVMCKHHSEEKICFLFVLYLAIAPLPQLKAFRLTIILWFFLLQWHSDVIP